MKRSEALKPLSRDHHQVLGVAQRLRRSEDPSEAALYFLVFWERHAKEHFRIEEEVLLPMWGALGTVDEDLAARMTREHRQIRTAAQALRSDPASATQMAALASQLHDHVRFEERELFEAIEADLGEDVELIAAAIGSREDAACALS